MIEEKTMIINEKDEATEKMKSYIDWIYQKDLIIISSKRLF
jgi:hypothetical protein